MVLTFLIPTVNLRRPGGKICFVGNPSDDILLRKDTYWKILRKQLTIKGTWNSLYLGDDKLAYKDDWHYVLNLLKEGKIHPELLITHKLNFKDLAQGLSIMRYKTQDYIKIMTAS